MFTLWTVIIDIVVAKIFSVFCWVRIDLNEMVQPEALYGVVGNLLKLI